MCYPPSPGLLQLLLSRIQRFEISERKNVVLPAFSFGHPVTYHCTSFRKGRFDYSDRASYCISDISNSSKFVCKFCCLVWGGEDLSGSRIVFICISCSGIWSRVRYSIIIRIRVALSCCRYVVVRNWYFLVNKPGSRRKLNNQCRCI